MPVEHLEFSIRPCATFSVDTTLWTLSEKRKEGKKRIFLSFSANIVHFAKVPLAGRKGGTCKQMFLSLLSHPSPPWTVCLSYTVFSPRCSRSGYKQNSRWTSEGRAMFKNIVQDSASWDIVLSPSATGCPRAPVPGPESSSCSVLLFPTQCCRDLLHCLPR